LEEHLAKKRDSWGTLETFSADEFIAERFDYRSGDHVTFLAPTQAGKTTLAFRLLQKNVSKDLPGIVMVMKPRDRIMAEWVETLKAQGWKLVRNWPPIVQKRPGWIVWPEHKFKTKEDNARIRAVFERVLTDSYKKGDRIIFADETYGLTDRLGLDDELITIWSQGAGMGCGLWAATQRPAHIPLWAYSQAEHIFLARDPDRRARQRYGEIGGINPQFVEYQVSRLEKYHWLYIRRTGPVACIVGP
jgi:hypothetical protein